jgi:hypothetical protein
MLLFTSLKANETGAHPWRSTDTRVFPPPSKIAPCRNTRSRAAGYEVIRAEKVSATHREGRTELALLLEFLRRGDTLVVTRVDRLARSIKDLQDIVYLLKERGVTSERPSSRSIPRVRRGKPFSTCWGCSPNLKPTSAGSVNRKGLPPPRPVGCSRTQAVH